MEKTITISELSMRLPEILEKVKNQGFQYIVQDNGVAVATIGPAFAKPGITIRELIARVGDLPMPGDGFADDLEAVQAEQGLAEFTEWPD